MSGEEFRVARPHPELRQLVRRYIGYQQADVPPYPHRGLPSGALTLVISLADPIRIVGGPGTARGPLSLRSLVGGLHLGPSLLAQDPYQSGLHIELNPLGVQSLLGVPAAELASEVVDVADLPVRWGRDLAARLMEADGWDDRFALLDREFRGTLRPVTPVGEIQWAWRNLRTTYGTYAVTDLASEIGWSRRHFSERFGREVGLPPKQVARLIRFERSTALIRAGRPLAEVAAEGGFYDQAHLTNEWRALAGCTPGTWIAEELPFLQDAEPPPGEDSGT